MSCGEPHATDCHEVIARLFAYLDQEIAELDCAKIREHLSECEPCLREYHLDTALKALIKRSCTGESAPNDLRHRIMDTLKQSHPQ